MSRHSSPFRSCFRPSTVTTPTDHRHPPPPLPPPPPLSGHPNLTTCLYHTHLALFSLTWSRTCLSRSLLLQINSNPHPFESPSHSSHPLSSSYSSSFLLHTKPFIFWKKHGSKKLCSNIRIFWDLTRAKFSSGPDPHYGFYIAVVVDGEMVLLVGDLIKEAYSRTKALKPKTPQSLLLIKEHVVAHKIYSTKARIGGKIREIQIDCGYNDETRLGFSFDNKRVMEINGLKWKFRGNEIIEIDGVSVQICWDVYNWVFEEEGQAIFMFRFGEEGEEECEMVGKKDGMVVWAQQQDWNGSEWSKIRSNLSSSSVSMSSVGSSSGNSSVMEWACVEESELSSGPSGFCLLIYAWKR